MDCHETSTNNYLFTLRNIQEERRYHLNCGGSLGLHINLIEKIPTSRTCVCVCACVLVFVRMCVCLFPKSLDQWMDFHENS